MLEVGELSKVIVMKDLQISLYKEKDSLKDDKISNLESVLKMKDTQLNYEKEKSDSLLKELKREKRKMFLYKVGSFIGIVSTTILLLL